MGIGLGVVCFVVWLLLSGYFDNVLLLSLGILSCALVIWLARRMQLLNADNPSLGFTLRFLGYLPWLMWEIIKANIAVARCILDPKLSISPTVFRVNTSQRSDLAKVLYANSITLTPGTVSLLVDDDNNQIEVHALTGASAEELAQGEMDRRVSAVEGQS